MIFELFLYIFAMWGIVQSVLLLIQYGLRMHTKAWILYPMYKESGDVFCALQSLNRLSLPVIAVHKNTSEMKSIEKEFDHVTFIEYSALHDFLQKAL